MKVWRAERDAGHEPLVVPSGGQGDDEPMAEGVAMTAYLVAHGLPPEAVATEDRATTTEENLLLSREILRSRGLDADGHLRVVTSSYHVGRSALHHAQPRHRRRRHGSARWRGTSCRARSCASSSQPSRYRPRTNVAGLVLWAASTAVLAYAVRPG